MNQPPGADILLDQKSRLRGDAGAGQQRGMDGIGIVGAARYMVAQPGCRVTAVDRTDFALDFFTEVMAKAAQGPQPLGIHLVMGDSAAEKLKNVKRNIELGCIVPVQMLARRRLSAES